MFELLKLVSPFGFGNPTSRSDDDHVDRLNHDFSVLMMIVFAVLVSVKQYAGDPIHCWVPGHFTSNYASYTNKVCWVSNTYFLPFEDPIPEETPKQMINYYQWVPLILLIQASLFYVPYTFWKNTSKKSGIDLDDLIKSSKDLKKSERKDRALKYMLGQVSHYLDHYKPRRSYCCCSALPCSCCTNCSLMCGKSHGNYLTCMYLCTKLLYLLNTLGQFFLLNIYLSTDFHMYGIRVMQSSLYNEDWPAAYIFPRETMCDFKIRSMGNVHRHTVQCVLSINFFNEKIYICIWFWLVFMSILNGYSIFISTIRFMIRRYRYRYVRHYLSFLPQIRQSSENDRRRKFTFEYLRQDGVLVLRLLGLNSNGLVVSELINALWDHSLSNQDLTDNGKLSNIC